MPAISLTDVEQLPDPNMEQDAILLLIWLEKPGLGDQRQLFMFIQGQKWSKAKFKKIVSHVLAEGWAMDDNGVLQITDAGRAKIGK